MIMALKIRLTEVTPVCKISASVDRNSRKCIKARSGTEEGIVCFRNEDATRIRVKPGQDGVGETGDGLGDCKTRTQKPGQEDASR